MDLITESGDLKGCQMERTTSIEPTFVLGGTGVGKRNANNSPLVQFLVVFMPDLNRYFANRLYFVSAVLRTFKGLRF